MSYQSARTRLAATETGKLNCPLCGRPLRQMARGRIKAAHSNCSILDSRINEIERRAKSIIWADEAAMKQFQSRLFSLKNAIFNSPKNLKIDPSSDEEF